MTDTKPSAPGAELLFTREEAQQYLLPELKAAQIEGRFSNQNMADLLSISKAYWQDLKARRAIMGTRTIRRAQERFPKLVERALVARDAQRSRW